MNKANQWRRLWVTTANHRLYSQAGTGRRPQIRGRAMFPLSDIPTETLPPHHGLTEPLSWGQYGFDSTYGHLNPCSDTESAHLLHSCVYRAKCLSPTPDTQFSWPRRYERVPWKDRSQSHQFVFTKVLPVLFLLVLWQMFLFWAGRYPSDRKCIHFKGLRNKTVY